VRLVCAQMHARLKKRPILVLRGAVGIGEGYRAIPRADIWIHRLMGQRLFGEEIDRRGLLNDIAADFASLGLWNSE
jgi:hypothetical protein